MRKQTDKDISKRIGDMEYTKPIGNPCPDMEKLGYEYEYCKGLVDKTPHYTRVEEDSIVYHNPRRSIRFNLASRKIVIQELEDNAEYYGGKPTLFFDPKLIRCINEIIDRLGWD